MLIGITGDVCAGKSEIARYLRLQGFTRIRLAKASEQEESEESTGTEVVKAGIDDLAIKETASSDHKHELKHKHKHKHSSAKAAEDSSIVFETVNEMLDFVTKRWKENFVTTNIWTMEVLNVLSKRPFFLHVNVEAPMTLRWTRYCTRYHQDISLEEFVKISDNYLYSRDGLAGVGSRAKVSLVNQTENLELLYASLGNLNLTDPTRLRPSWDAYFMRLANLAALRSNCMKRQVGCVLVRDKRVISTGYNGTPRGLTNCNDGGCGRCNSGNSSGQGLGTCLCLHAEENALLEAGRERMGSAATLYCNTCPCLTCSIKIAQCGIKEVVYSQSYSMDTQSAQVLHAGGVVLRQYSPPSEAMVL